MDFLKEIVKEIGDEYTQIAADIDETERFIDTGSYILILKLQSPRDYLHLVELIKTDLLL